MSSASLVQFIAKALDKGWVRECPHSEFDRAYRNISDEDIQFGLERKGWTIEKVEPSGKKRFKYTILTADIEGDELHLVILPDTGTGTIQIITKY